MQLMPKRKLVTAIAVLATAAAAGGAYAATQTPQASPRQALLNDAAQRLKVTPQELTDALRGAFFDQLNAAVAAGRLTQAQADQIKQRVLKSAGEPTFFGRPRLGFRGIERGFAFPGGAGQPGPGEAGHGGRVAAAADYLGLNPKQLFDQLSAGKSLAQIAQARGKSASGLKSAMLAKIHAKLDRAVASRLITAAQEQEMLRELPARLDAEINRTGFRAGLGSHGRDGAPGMGPDGPTGAPLMPPPGPAGLAGPSAGVPGPAY